MDKTNIQPLATKGEQTKMSDKVVMNRTVNISWDTWERLQLFCKIHGYRQSYVADCAINKFLDIQPTPVGVESVSYSDKEQTK